MSSENTKEPIADNVHVVVRLRPRSQKEIKENSPVIATAEAVKCSKVQVRMSQSDAMTKTYNFDKVMYSDFESITTVIGL